MIASRLLLSPFFAACLLAGPAQAQQGPPATGGEMLGRLFDAAKLRSAPLPPPDFVQQTRPDPSRLDYVPVAPADAPRAAHKKTPEELQALGAGLDRAIAENRRKAARVKIPDAGAPAARGR